MTPDQAAICDVLDRYMGSSLLQDRQAEIVRQYGPAIYAEARRITQEAVNVSIDWSKASMEDGLDAMAAAMRSRYPWLNRAAMAGLSFGFTVTWK
jgi:hypothetical protein